MSKMIEDEQNLKEKWRDSIKAKHVDDQMVLDNNYYDLALFSMFITENDVQDQVDFEKLIIKNNLKLKAAEQAGERIGDDHPLKKAYDNQCHELKIRKLKDNRLRAVSQKTLFKAMTIFVCQIVMVIGALTFYWNTGVVAPLDFRCMIIRFIALFQGHITYQP